MAEIGMQQVTNMVGMGEDNISLVNGRLPHVYDVDLYGDGVEYQVVVLKKDEGGFAFIRLDQLDQIDLKRLFKVVSSRNAANFELWDLLSNTFLGNGMNALVYFHQMVKYRTNSGKVIPMQHGVRSAVRNAPATQTAQSQEAVQPQKVVQPQEAAQPAVQPAVEPIMESVEEAQAPETAKAEAPPAKRGRPAKSKGKTPTVKG